MGRAAAISVSAIFTLAAVGKLVRGGLGDYLVHTGMFAPPVGRPVAAAVPFIELLGASLLLWPRGRQAGWILVGAMSAGFAFLHACALVMGDAVPSGCLGVRIARDAWTEHALMLGLCVAVTVGAFVCLRPGAKQAASRLMPIVSEGGAR